MPQRHDLGAGVALRGRDLVVLGMNGHRWGFGKPRPREAEQAERALGAVGALEFADDPVEILSGGQQQRLFIAQALPDEVEILLLDEPLAGLDIADFRVSAGERVFLHGPSGSGKSSMLSLIGGVSLPECGQVRVLGTDVARLRGAARDRFRAEHLGFVFQLFNLIPYLSALDNIVLPCRFSARRRAAVEAAGRSVRDEARRLAKQLDLAPHLLERSAAELSVGQQQRVAAARALIGRPQLVIADEPTSALDADRERAFLELLLSECAATGAAVLLVSHDVRLADRFDRAVALAEINRAMPDLDA